MDSTFLYEENFREKLDAFKKDLLHLQITINDVELLGTYNFFFG